MKHPKLNVYLLLWLFVLWGNPSYTQDSPVSVHTRNVIWTTPVRKNTIINGIAIGIQSTTGGGANLLKINGLNIELEPFGIIGGLYAIGGTIASISRHSIPDSMIQGRADLVSRTAFTENNQHATSKIKGVSFSLGGLMDNLELSGVGINGVISFANRVNGIELTGIMNLHYEFNGIMIAGLRNKVTKVNGLQVGLINTCKDGRVVQLGLINRIGKRITPVLNFKLR